MCCLAQRVTTLKQQ
ncbi:UNVERIFIED_CONTAM: hypothetical protein GTU68_036658 [Idotea baltica]|nr:hypothetical protein [Idotea baltica]